MLLSDPGEYESVSKVLLYIYLYIAGTGVVTVGFLIFALLLKKWNYGKTKT